MPVLASSASPSGRFSAEKRSGASPVAGIRNRNGRPGRAAGDPRAVDGRLGRFSRTMSGRGCSGAAAVTGLACGVGSQQQHGPGPIGVVKIDAVAAGDDLSRSSFGAGKIDGQQLGLVAARISPLSAFFLPSTQTSNPTMAFLRRPRRPRRPWRRTWWPPVSARSASCSPRGCPRHGRRPCRGG